jgi:hypothetical protein
MLYREKAMEKSKVLMTCKCECGKIVFTSQISRHIAADDLLNP